MEKMGYPMWIMRRENEKMGGKKKGTRVHTCVCTIDWPIQKGDLKLQTLFLIKIHLGIKFNHKEFQTTVNHF